MMLVRALRLLAATVSLTLLPTAPPALAEPQQAGAPGTLESCKADPGSHLCVLARACTAAPKGKQCQDGLMAEAFQSAQWVVENAASKALGQVAARFSARNDRLGGLVRDYEAANTKVQALETDLIGSFSKSDAARQAALQAELAKARDDAARIDGQLRAENFGDFQEMSRPRPISLAETQALLRPGEAMVFYMTGRSSTFVWVVTSSAAAWKQIELTDEELAQKILALRRNLDPEPGCTRGQLTGRRNATVGPTFDFALSHELYEDLIGPVAATLANSRKIIIAPSGSLMSLPFAVLTASPAPAHAIGVDDYRNASWFGLAKALVVLPAPSSLRALRCPDRDAATNACKPRTGRAAPAQQMIGFGNPLLHAEGQPAVVEDASAGRRSGCSGSKDVYASDALSQDGLSRLSQLPETETELRAIASAIGGTSQLFLAENATEARLKTLPLSASLIVFATHGLIANEISGVEEAGLVLTRPALEKPPRTPDAIDNGYLTVSEAAQLRITADWVVLSACNTALGDRAGSQGLSGLTRAFFYAGADALLVSHWPVYDDAAAVLTSRTIKRVADDPKIDRAEALRLTMREIATDPKQASLRVLHPGFWAPFIFVGL